MAEWLCDQRGGTCTQCGGQFQTLARHWSQSQTCEFRSLSDHQRAIVRGLLLGDGSLEANELTYLRCGSKRQAHLEWLAEELGWLARGVTIDTSETYRLRIMSHPNLGRYWTWMDAPSTGYTLTPTAARVWYTCDGTLSFAGGSDVPQIMFAASSDAKRTAVAQLLSQRGFDPLTWDRRIALPREQTKRWLSWLGDPAPDSEYKWCTDEPAYREQR